MDHLTCEECEYYKLGSNEKIERIHVCMYEEEVNDGKPVLLSGEPPIRRKDCNL